jgi:hypothetical protein
LNTIVRRFEASKFAIEVACFVSVISMFLLSVPRTPFHHMLSTSGQAIEMLRHCELGAHLLIQHIPQNFST